MKVILFSGSLILFVWLAGCTDNSGSFLMNGESSCWNYIPLESKFEFDSGAGVCFFKDGMCFDYVSRDSLKIPFSSSIFDVSEYELKDILMNWTVKGDSLSIGRRKYSMLRISNDTILIENYTDSILLVHDNTDYRIYWGHVIEDVPRNYLD